ncbi:DNA helicase [Antrihabitans sp. YC2-6]|nr:DNA helicase [Antrihabitans sp. YC2-6]
MASPEAARTVINLLKPADFYRPVCAALLFTVITRLVTESRPHRSALVLAELPRAGKVSGLLSRALTDVALADAREHEISHYARAVLAQSYRRGYATAAVTLAQLAAEASEDELFEQMCVLGRARRDAKARLDAGADSHSRNEYPRRGGFRGRCTCAAATRIRHAVERNPDRAGVHQRHRSTTG